MSDKRQSSESNVDRIQTENRAWWTRNTMSYDWNDRIGLERFSEQWFEEADRRFIHGARLFAHGGKPFDRIIPFDAIRGRDVLEIGCGMGLHTELIARAGARVTTVDISDTSVEATKRRLALRGLAATVRQMDARTLDFPDASFDLVWSWGVIHHSAQTAVILREIARVLRSPGEARIMVYNLNGMSAYASIVRDYLFGFWRGRSIDDGLWKRSDGYMARHYSKDSLSDILSLFFTTTEIRSVGQDADAVPLPRQVRPLVLRMMSHEGVAQRANARGSMLFAVARK